MSDIHGKLAKIAAAIGPINKDELNKEQNFKFRSIEQITDRARPLLADAEISVAPKVLTIEHTEVTSRNNTRGFRCVVTMQYTFTAASDDSALVVEMPGEAIDYGDKSTSKACQMAYKYALTQALMIGSGEADPDGQSPDFGGVVREPGQQRPTAPPPAEAPPEEVSPELWNELYALQAVWPSNEETMAALEKRMRRLYELMELTGLWKGGSLHAALRLKAKVEHVSDLRKDALKDFAVVSWQAAQDVVQKLEASPA